MFSKLSVFLACLAIANAALIPTGYNFGYNIDGATDGQSREERRDENGNVAGHYTIRDSDGRSRRVTYTAGADGFHANVESNEQGVLAKSSANAQFNGAELPKPGSLSEGSFESHAPVFQPSEHLVPTGYNFGYNIDGATDGQSREESGEAGRVRGSYTIRDSDGRSRRVSYTADENGFKANIDTNEHGTAAKSPADTTLNSPFAAPVPVEPLPVPAVALPVGPTHSFSSSLSLSGPSTTFVSHAPVVYEAPKLVSAGAAYTSKSHSTINYGSKVEHAPLTTFSQTHSGPILRSYEQKIDHSLSSKSYQL